MDKIGLPVPVFIVNVQYDNEESFSYYDFELFSSAYSVAGNGIAIVFVLTSEASLQRMTIILIKTKDLSCIYYMQFFLNTCSTIWDAARLQHTISHCYQFHLSLGIDGYLILFKFLMVHDAISNFAR